MKKSLYLLLSGCLLIGVGTSCKKEGCTDPSAENYNADAKKDDGSCTYVEGCTDPDAVNYNASATKDDGSCTYEFVAENSTFSNYASSWTLVATNVGGDPALIGEIHGGDDTTTTRYVYFFNDQDAVDGKYPRGTVIVKRSQNESGSIDITTAMVKRGGDFNPANNGWEWFMLNADGTIAKDSQGNELRGATLNDGSCGACHSYAATDFIFSK